MKRKYPEFLGKGSYSSVFRISDEVACKVITFNDNLAGSFSEYRSEYAEPCIHLLLAECAQVINFVGYKDSMMLLEYANRGQLFHYSYSRMNDEIFMKFYTQVIDGLVWITDRYPRFSHNDLSTTNVLLSGDVAKIGDFDLARIPGLVDNYKVFDWRMSYPTYNFGIDARADAYKFVNTFLDKFQGKLSAELKSRISRAYGNFTKRANVFQPTPAILRGIADLRGLRDLLPKILTKYDMWPIGTREEILPVARFRQYIPTFSVKVARQVLTRMSKYLENTPNTWQHQVWAFCEAVRCNPYTPHGYQLLDPTSWANEFGHSGEEDVDSLLQVAMVEPAKE